MALIEININKTDIVSKITRHLSVIAKRAKDAQGNLLFSDITVSQQEKEVFTDMILSAASAVASELTPFMGVTLLTPEPPSTDAGGFTPRANEAVIPDATNPGTTVPDASPSGIKFLITVTRNTDAHLDDTTGKNNKNLSAVLGSSINEYLFNHALATYLSAIHPSSGERYYQSYFNQCSLVIDKIVRLCNVKRAPSQSVSTYADIKGEIESAEFGDSDNH